MMKPKEQQTPTMVICWAIEQKMEYVVHDIPRNTIQALRPPPPNQYVLYRRSVET